MANYLQDSVCAHSFGVWYARAQSARGSYTPLEPAGVKCPFKQHVPRARHISVNDNRCLLYAVPQRNTLKRLRIFDLALGGKRAVAVCTVHDWESEKICQAVLRTSFSTSSNGRELKRSHNGNGYEQPLCQHFPFRNTRICAGEKRSVGQSAPAMAVSLAIVFIFLAVPVLAAGITNFEVAIRSP